MDFQQCARKITPGVPFESPTFEIEGCKTFVFDEHGYVRLRSLEGKLVHASRKLSHVSDFMVACPHETQFVQNIIESRGLVFRCDRCGMDVVPSKFITKPPTLPTERPM